MEHIEKRIEEKIKEFVETLNRGIAEWQRAGDLIVEMLEIDPYVADKICAAVPGLPKDVIYKFESIGRREVHPQLLISNAPGVRKLASMPYSIQERYIKQPIDLLVAEKGETTILKVKAESLTADQSKQVFSNFGVRDLGEQRAWIESEKRKAELSKVEAAELPYAITGNKVTFRSGCVMTKKELNNIIKML